MDNARISVIIGIYNCASTLVEALDSIYAQTYQRFKIILCDDGSSDNTFMVAEKYASRYKNIILIKNEKNMGLNYTLNRCLEYADTEYVARMDGDDISLPERFEKEVSFLDEHPEYAIVSTPMLYFDENGIFNKGKVIDLEPTKESFNYGSPFCHAPCMVRREAYESVGGYTIDKRLLRMEDYNLWMKMYTKGYIGYNLDECLYAMRDDRKASKRRTLRARLNGIYAHKIAMKELHLSKLCFLKYALSNVTKGLLPISIYEYLRKKYNK